MADIPNYIAQATETPTEFKGYPILITALAYRSWVDGCKFEDCTIHGPAVLAPRENVTFVDCTFAGDVADLFWEVLKAQKHVVGAIGLKNCVFRGCRFVDIGFVANRDDVKAMRAALEAGGGVIGGDLEP